MKKLSPTLVSLFSFSVFFMFQSVSSCLDGIYALDFSEDDTVRIMREIDELLNDNEKTSLDFSKLSAPYHIGELIKILYMHMYPYISAGGPMKNKEYLDAYLKHINLSGNMLTRIPIWLSDFPDLRTANCTGNDFPMWVRRNMMIFEGKIHISI